MEVALQKGLARTARLRGLHTEADVTRTTLDTHRVLHRTVYRNDKTGIIVAFVYIMGTETNGLEPIKIGMVHKLGHYIGSDWKVTLVCNSISAQSVVYLRSICKAVQVLSFIDIAVDRFCHRDVPHYKTLTEAEIKSLETSIGTRTAWPRIVSGQDPIARIMWKMPGECIKIISRSPISGVVASYRYVS